MKRVTIKACNFVADEDNGKKSKVLIGEREVDQPQTITEAVELFGEKYVLDHFWDSEVIIVQRELRAGAETPTNVKLFRSLSPEKQLEALKAAGKL